MNRTVLAAICLLGTMPLDAIGQENPFTTTSPANPFVASKAQRYEGVFESDAVRLELAKGENGLTGALYYSATERTYAVSAQLMEQALEGHFSAGGSDFAFTFTLEENGETGRFETEGYSGVLTAHSATPPPPSQVEEIFDEAIALANTLPAEKRGFVVSSMASLIAQTGNTDDAMELTESLPPGDIYRSAALVGVAGGMLKTEGLEAARRVMNGVVEPNMRNSFDATYTLYLAEEGQLSEAYAFAASLNGNIGALMLVAQEAHEAGDTATADAALSNARTRVSGLTEKAARDSGFYQLAISHAQLGDAQAAKSFLDEIEDNDYLQVLGYASIIEQLVRDDNRDVAAQFAADAFRKAKRIKPNALRPGAVAAVTPAYAALRDTEKLQEIAEWVHQRNEHMVSVVLNSMIRTQIKFRYLDAARTNMAQLVDKSLESEILQAVAYDQAEAGDIDGALQTARGISSSPVRATSLATIAHILYLQSTGS